MDTIYKGAMRVVAYLESCSTTPSGRNYPPRTCIGDLESAVLETMLKFRYFGRLWVIQELILARSVVFVFGGVECHAQASTISKSDWTGTPAPWLMHLAARSFGADEGLTDVLHLTSKSTCADRRDLCFGTLGLVQQDVVQGLQPDYTLSALHLFVGLASHCLINEDRQLDVIRGPPHLCLLSGLMVVSSLSGCLAQHIGHRLKLWPGPCRFS